MSDRYDRSGDGSGNFVMGLLAGAVVGAGLALLFAPKKGADLRNQLSDQADALANQAQEGYRKVANSAGQWADKGKVAAGDLADRGKDLYGQAREAVAHGADEAQKYVRETAAKADGAIPASIKRS
jgi:gas vesicle protein